MTDTTLPICSSCDTPVPTEATWCPSCGVRLGDAPAHRVRPATPVAGDARGRRAFVYAAGASLAAVTVGTTFFGLRRSMKPSTKSSTEPKADETPASEAKPEPARSLADDYEPDRGRVYSRGAYEGLVVAAAPYRSIAERAKQGVTPVKLRAIELDLISNDTYWRDGELVILGEQDGMLVGFTHRYVVDHSYPANSLNSDGFGAADWGRHSLVVNGERTDLRKLGRNQRPSSSDDHIAWQPIDKHDAAVLYIPKRLQAFAALPKLGIPEPVEVVRKAVRDSSEIFGLDFVLISPRSFAELREHASSQLLTLQVFLAGVALGALFFAPLLGQLAAGVTISSSTLAQTGRRVLAKALPTIVKLAGRALLDEQGLDGDQHGPLELLGVELPREGEGLAMVGKFLDAVLSDSEGHYVPYSGRGVRGGQLFVPEREMNLNAELLSRGLAKLDLDNLDALREHPQLVDAALAALDSRRNLAADWSEDEAYRGMVEMLQRG